MGAIMFEMLIGYPPFYSEEPMATCRKIVHWKQYLRFPPEAQLSPEARDLICRLLCDVDGRLGSNGSGELRAHPFFAGVAWAGLYDGPAPYTPEVHGELDTRNFEHFEEDAAMTPSAGQRGAGAKLWGAAASAGGKPPDPNFIGYTFKNFEVVVGGAEGGEGRVVKAKPKARATLASVFPGAAAAAGAPPGSPPRPSASLTEPPQSPEFPGL